MKIEEALRALTERRDLSADEMGAVMRQIMTGGATPAQIGGFLIALRMKGETTDEIAAAARVMRELATRVEVGDDQYLVDTCGTGGDASGLFNVSTATALVAAAAGAKVAKHGNRSVSSSSGSADVLEAAGVKLDLSPEQVGQCIREVGVGFLFAPAHHSAMKHAIGPRKEMGVRTIFNVLGPLTNPAGAPNQLLGVYDEARVEPLAEVLGELGSRHVMVVHSADGLDEISIAGPTHVAELRDGVVSTYTIAPGDVGLPVGVLDALRVNDAAGSLALIRSVLDGEDGPARDIILMNAGAAIYVAGLAEDLQGGVDKAREVIDSGAARQVLERLGQFSQSAGTA